jgi:flagellar biosynthesis/type III secretory pathway chaperone
MYKHSLKELWKKLNLKNKKMIFVQYASNNKCYCLWDPHTHKITIVSNVGFDEGI